MNIYIYSDESGVLDKLHNKYFVFGGVVFTSKDDRDSCNYRYIHAEKIIRKIENKSPNQEVKASAISNANKNKLYRSLNNVVKFGVVVEQGRLHNKIFDCKKSKQRYLDYAYKIGVKDCFQHLLGNGVINAEEVKNLYFFVDEHTTATNGTYELRESLEQEFKHGTINYEYQKYFPPIFSSLESVQLTFCDSKSKALVRAADIVANRIYYNANNNIVSNGLNLFVKRLP